jgi:DNA-directed RNA polymerase subunit K/omega
MEDFEIVKPENRITSNKLSKYEMINIVGQRAEMIRDDVALGNHSKIFVDINTLDKDKLHDSIYIALAELKAFKLPFILERKIGNKKIERWHLINDKMYYIK